MHAAVLLVLLLVLQADMGTTGSKKRTILASCKAGNGELQLVRTQEFVELR